MKRTIILKGLEVCLAITYACCMLYFGEFWYSFFLIFLSIPLAFKAAIFRHDSKLFGAVFLALCGGLGIYLKVISADWIMYIISYIFSAGIAAFTVFTFFRQNIHLKVFAICIFEVLLLSIFKFAYIKLVDFLIIQVVFAVQKIISGVNKCSIFQLQKMAITKRKWIFL